MKHKYYFIGIGGIGMSALARYFKHKGEEVFGYDKTESPLTKLLVKEGIPIVYSEDTEHLNKFDSEATTVVYTPAIPKDNKLLNFFKLNSFTMLKRAQMLGEISKNTTCLAVAGTHGKTTTSSILGHIMAHSNMPVTAFLGGISENYNSNFIYKGDQISVVEADEFDRSFLTLYPSIACITSLDADHLDIYKDEEDLKNAFEEFANRIPDSSSLFVKKGLPISGTTVAVDETADVMAFNVKVENGRYHFSIKVENETHDGFTLALPGKHNLFNALIAIAMALKSKVVVPQIKDALKSFAGVQRRFSIKVQQENLVLIDDYAHHPTELDALFQGVKEFYPESKNCVVFQPHLFSRTRDFQDAFAESLAQFDEVFLLDIYPAREKPIQGVTSQALIEMLPEGKGKLISKNEIASVFKNSASKIKIIAGAGDIGNEVDSLVKQLSYEG